MQLNIIQWTVFIIIVSAYTSMSGSSSFEPPAERAAFLDAKGKLDPSNPSELDTLRKMLMRRAVKAIPILLSLQNEGNSIERLYKRGMLTDDMHFKVKDVKNFVDQEFQDVQNDAEELMEGWGQRIWPEAMQFHTVS
jgi:Preprotein translocase subunit Sec66